VTTQRALYEQPQRGRKASATAARAEGSDPGSSHDGPPWWGTLAKRPLLRDRES
jgi:hypothetical protein